VTRSCVRTRSVWARLATYVIEPAGFLMTRRMLLGLKQRAEGLRASSIELCAGVGETSRLLRQTRYR